jgi:hypothetical protein
MALAIPIWSDFKLSADAEELVEEIAGVGARPELLATARRIAEAQIDLRRIRQERRQVIELGLINVDRSERLEAIDRYERRALSRRNVAIRQFDAARGYFRALGGAR